MLFPSISSLTGMSFILAIRFLWLCMVGINERGHVGVYLINGLEKGTPDSFAIQYDVRMPFFRQLQEALCNAIIDMNDNGDASDEIPMSVTKEFLPYMFGPAFGLDLVSGFQADENGNVIDIPSLTEERTITRTVDFTKE